MTKGIDTNNSADDFTTVHRRLDEHYKMLVNHIADDKVRYDQQMDLSKKNLEAIAKLTTSTQAVVNAWATANNLQKFVKWLGGFGLVAAAVAWYLNQF